MEKASLYSKNYFQKQEFFPQHFSYTLLLLFKELGIKKVLDVGCGTGLLVQFLNENGFEALGCDIADEALKIARTRNKRDSLIKASAQKLPFKNQSFDLICAISLIEHLTSKETKKFLAETRRVLKPRGYFFLVTPNFWSLMRLLKGKGWFGYSDPTHITFYTPLSLTSLLRKEGFSHFRFWFKIPKDLPFDWWFAYKVEKLPKTIKHFISFLLISTPLALVRESFFVCARRSSPK